MSSRCVDGSLRIDSVYTKVPLVLCGQLVALGHWYGVGRMVGSKVFRFVLFQRTRRRSANQSALAGRSSKGGEGSSGVTESLSDPTLFGITGTIQGLSSEESITLVA